MHIDNETGRVHDWKDAKSKTWPISAAFSGEYLDAVRELMTESEDVNTAALIENMRFPLRIDVAENQIGLVIDGHTLPFVRGKSRVIITDSFREWLIENYK
jgi:hypothetical protein